MKRFIGLLLSVVMLTGILAGCAGTPADNSGTSTPESSPAATDTSTSETSDTSASDANSTEEGAWPRTVIDSQGNEVIIEKKPERIASVVWTETEVLLALGVYPVGSQIISTLSEWESTKDYIAAAPLSIQNIENIEQVLELAPDLILGYPTEEKNLENYQKIATTVLVKNDREADWRDKLRETAIIVGEEQAAEDFITEVELFIKTSRSNLNSLGVSDKTVFLGALGEKAITAFGKRQLTAFYDTGTGLGLKAPERYPVETDNDLSLEGLSELNPDYIFVSVGSENIMQSYQNNSVWNNLKAVKDGHVYVMNISAFTGGPLAIQYGLTTLVNYLTN